jgi:hypothetical protein
LGFANKGTTKRCTPKGVPLLAKLQKQTPIPMRMPSLKTQFMQFTKKQTGLAYEVTLVLIAALLLMVLVQYMNREGFEERFGYDSQREPQFGMSDGEIEQQRWQMMASMYGGGHHHH